MWKAIISGALSSIAIFTALFIWSLKSDENVYFKLASKLIGRPPQPGDGAFQFPLGWLLMVLTGVTLGLIVASVVYFIQDRK